MKETPSDPVNYQLTPEDIGAAYSDFLEAVTNVPDSPALLPLPIDRVGITRQSISINLPSISDHDRTAKPAILPVHCEVEASASLGSRRGVHMSRFEEGLFDVAKEGKFDSIDSFALEVARTVRNRQGSTESFVRIQGSMLCPRITPISKKISHDAVTLIAEAHCSESSEKVFTGVQAYNVTACPCTRAFTKFSVVPSLLAQGFTLEQIKIVLDTVLSGTHLQRGTVTLKVEKTSNAVGSAVLFYILDKATHLVFDLLKRPDEHELVIRALKRPQFTEDVARDISLAAYQQLGELVPPATAIDVHSVLQDSIHIHDVFTHVQTTFSDLDRVFASR